MSFPLEQLQQAGETGLDGSPGDRLSKEAYEYIIRLRASNAELLAALDEALPFVAHFLGGWSTHTHAQISTRELHDQITAAIAKAEKVT